MVHSVKLMVNILMIVNIQFINDTCIDGFTATETTSQMLGLQFQLTIS